MKLTLETPQPRRPLAVLAGLVKIALAAVLVWFGLHSALVGWAYQHQKGAVVPIIVGGLSGLVGLRLLWKGVGQAFGGSRQRSEEFGA